jgi:hypothetical protein
MKHLAVTIIVVVLVIFGAACVLSFFSIGYKYFAVPHVGCGSAHHNLYVKSKPNIKTFESLEPYPGAKFDETKLTKSGDCFDSDPRLFLNKSGGIAANDGASVLKAVQIRMKTLGYEDLGTNYSLDCGKITSHTTFSNETLKLSVNISAKSQGEPSCFSSTEGDRTTFESAAVKSIYMSYDSDQN